jgi:uncharacterized protein
LYLCSVKIKTKKGMDVIIHHNADPDGNFGGAVCLKKFPDATVIGYNYEPQTSTIITACIGKHVVMMVDVSFKWGDMHRLLDACASLTWIDHHASAWRECEAAGTVNLYAHKFTVVYEREQWGCCRIAFQHFFPGKQVPLSIAYVAQYDVWREYGSGEWNGSVAPFRHITGRLRSPQAVLERFNFTNIAADYAATMSATADGRAIGAHQDAENADLVHSAACFEAAFVAGDATYRVLALNRPLAGDMFKARDTSGYDFVAGFSFARVWKVSLRGTGKDIDLGALAKQYGGGGHKNAAGFTVRSFADLALLLPTLR